MVGQFGDERRKTEGDSKIESDQHENQHQMRVESLDNQVLDCILLINRYTLYCNFYMKRNRFVLHIRKYGKCLLDRTNFINN